MTAMPVRDVQQLWQHHDIVLCCARPDGLEDQPDLALRVRGALGNALEELCGYAPSRPCPFVRESAHDLLYYWPAPQVATDFGPLEVAVPWVVRADMRAQHVTIVIRLMGEAHIHAPLVCAAALMALEGGVALRNHAIRVPFPVLAVDEFRFDGGAKDWADQASSVLLRFQSPVVIRARNDIRLEPEAVMRSACRRVAALAPWMGFALAADEAALRRAIFALRFRIDIHPEHWVRTSRRDPGTGIEVFGYGGSMRAEGALEALLPYLQLVEWAGVGGECASGFGAFDMVVWP